MGQMPFFKMFIDLAIPQPVQVYIDGFNTTVEFDDGSKVTVGVHDEPYSFEKGVMAAITKRFVERWRFKELIKTENIKITHYPFP